MKKSTPIQFIFRILIYCLGMFILATGVAFSVNGNLGVSPVNSFPFVVSQILGVQLGTCVTVFFCFLILLQIIILRREFRPINLLQIVFSTIFGYFVDFAKMLLGDFCFPTYFGQLAMVAISIVFIGLGVMLFMQTDLVPMPMEGLIACVAKKTNKPFPKMKSILDSSVVVIAVILSLVWFRSLLGVREGTIITAILAGRLVGVFKKPLGPIVDKICFSK
ncbi:MAG: hypothetical protein E7449_04175 [Ruminococcaceae bacterium]|nr:hypothetical protein [Oscillospiraceae bacterium]